MGRFADRTAIPPWIKTGRMLTHAADSGNCRRRSSTRSPRGKSSNVRPASSRNCWRTRSTPAPLGSMSRWSRGDRAGPGVGQRLRHPGRRTAVGRHQPCHQQAAGRGRPVSRADAGLSRRSPGLDRRGQPSVAAQLHRMPAGWAASRSRRRASRPRSCPAVCPAERSSRFAICSSTRPSAASSCGPQQTELGHASEAFHAIALAHPQVHFTLQHQDAVPVRPAPTDSWRERIATFFGDEIARQPVVGGKPRGRPALSRLRRQLRT